MTTAKSIPATDTIHVPPSSPASAEAPQTTEVTNVAETTEATVASRTSLMFPLALTVLAIFPLALGIGTVRLKAAASASRTNCDTLDTEHNEEVSRPLPNITDRRLGDRDFFARRYEVALQYYESLGDSDPARLPPDLLYRIALCQEGLGRWNEALGNLRSVVGTTDDSLLKAAASFGQARLRLRMNEPHNALPLLLSLVFRPSSDRPLPRNMSRDIAFLIPLTMAQETLSHKNQTKDWVPARLGELLGWSLESALEWIDQPQQTEASVPDANVPANSLSCQLQALSAPAAESNAAIESREAQICCQSQPLKLIVQRIADECGWTLDWTDTSHAPALNRIVDFSVEDQPISLTLTMLCSELHSVWSVAKKQLGITRIDHERTRSRQMISLTLANLADWIPHHRLANYARFAQAEIARYDGRPSDAVHIYESLVGRESSPLTIRAAYNAAVIYYQNGDYSRACRQLDYVVNGAPEYELHTESLILLGQLLMDHGEAQQAVFQFRRATEAHKRPQAQARAAVLLGFAYLAQNKFTEAADAIFANRFHLEEPAVRTAASFVTAFARWQSVKGEMQERETAFLYRSLVSMPSETEWLGQTGQMMVGRAYSEIGFDDRMAERYSHLLAAGVTDHIAPELNYSLANYEQTRGQTDSAVQMWTTLASGSSSLWANRSRLRLAEVALTAGRAKDCLEYCESIDSDEGIVRKDILKLQGRAYESLGEDVLAAKCYAGRPPKLQQSEGLEGEEKHLP